MDKNENNIRHVAILGAGGLGAVYAKILHEGGINTRIVADGERYKRYVTQGFYINDVHHLLPVIRPTETGFAADLIIVATKYHHLQKALPDLANFVADHTIFVSLLNGLTSETIIGDSYGHDKMLLAIAMNLDAVRLGNRISHTRPPLLIFGEPQNHKLSPRVERVHALLDIVGIEYRTPVDMQRELWWKFMVNVGLNQSSAVTGATYGRYKTEADLRWLKERLMLEVVAVAQAEGINLTKDDVSSFYQTIDKIAPDGKTSMLQDIEAGRKTEVEMFAPVVIELGEKHGIPTPVNQTILAIIRTIEAKVT
ncbi:MAG: ketopantoate reductase family protein [Chloroflexota bacterium]